ncbi:hypothetical protein LWI28_008603 [Acer negundo]|uniref:Uncharacterized protein n=1 Tax=Acer negundo TaxID=4023 RepID=A0AAD5JIJ4_ACENE|nr:hypothetical protein LWI28_008603 [Acer negundo]
MEDTDGCLLFAGGGVWCLPNKKKLTTSSTVKNRRDCKPFLWRHDASLIPVTASAVCVMEEARLWPPLIGRRLAAPLPPITIKGWRFSIWSSSITSMKACSISAMV